jgi:hypothetical protein
MTATSAICNVFREDMPHFCGRVHSVRTRLDPAEPDADGGRWRAPTHEEIARLAYSYWEARGCRGGSPVEDWLRAEREIQQRDTAP